MSLRAKAVDYLIDAGISSAGISTIWGLSLSDWDFITKIICTLAVSTVAITLQILHHRKKK